jgi:hypothetical protein
MDVNEATERLTNHANLPGTQLSEDRSLVFALGQADRIGKAPLLGPFVDDILVCLATLNEAFNGAVPSQQVSGKVEAVPRQVAYAMACILTSCIEFRRRWDRKFAKAELAALDGAAETLAGAWEQMLAGDIDDLRER